MLLCIFIFVTCIGWTYIDRHSTPHGLQLHNARRNTVEDKLQLEKITDGRFKLCKIMSDWQLREFLNRGHLEYWRGCAYYEFRHELETNIFKDKRLLFLKVSQCSQIGECHRFYNNFLSC